MKAEMEYDGMIVLVEWDPEAEVWVATSDDIPGLVAEAPTSKELIEKVSLIVPDLLELNAHLLADDRPKKIKAVFRSFEAPIEYSTA